MNSMDGPPNQYDHKGQADGSGNVWRLDPAYCLAGLGQMLDQSHDVVGDSRHRQAFNGRLQLQLQALPFVHGAQKLLAVLLLLEGDPGAQQVAHARDAFRQRGLSP